MTLQKKNHLELFKLIHDSFKNEIALEYHIAKKLSKHKNFIPFKVLQFSSLFSKPSSFYFLFLYTLCLFFVLSQLFIGLLFLLGFWIRFFIKQKSKKNLIITSAAYKNITRDAIIQLKLSEDCFCDATIYNLLFMVKKSRLLNYLFFIFGFTRYIIVNFEHVFVNFLNYKDILKLYLISVYVFDNKDIVVCTEDHYQRFAFVASHLQLANFVIVQHGYIDNSIKFPAEFGSIDNLYLRDIQFLKSFEVYFKVNNFDILKRDTATMFSTKNLKASCFLASSAPFIDNEIKFAELFKSKYNLPLLIKKHPRHTYNREKLKVLLTFADQEWVDGGNMPNSDLFISFDSFLEFEYKSAGSFTFKLANYHSSEKIFEDPLFKNAMISLMSK